MSNSAPRPPVYVTESEFERLSDLADAAGREPAAATLAGELARALISESSAMPDNVVRMHDQADFIYDGVEYEGFTLVYPNEANIAERRISILTQVGAMLIGLPAGSMIDWTGQDGRAHRLEVLSVAQRN